MPQYIKRFAVIRGRAGLSKMRLKKLPIGIENFREIIEDDFYYVDKTRLIEQLIEERGKANLFTRPRRFGKSLNMSMLKCFFEAGSDIRVFDGLYISGNKALCDEYMGKFPVVSVSLKGANAESFDTAKRMLANVINEEARRHQFLLDSDNLSKIDKDQFALLLKRNMDTDTVAYSLRILTELLSKHYGRKVIVIIDEYDVPLAKANERGYYDEMLGLLRNLFENVLKTNDNLFFSVLSGCLRIAKESIFTGLNNFKVFSITDVDFDEYFGFSDDEVRNMLAYYDQNDHYDTVKAWYDGYRFGNVDVYCPWDVINYVDAHKNDPSREPQNYWLNTSGNDIIRHFIDDTGKNGQLTKAELEALVNGDSIEKEITQELTYKELYSKVDNIWSALFMTGYLTQRSRQGNRYELIVPNREIRNIIIEHILAMFRKSIGNDGEMIDSFCSALESGRTSEAERLFTLYIQKTISIRDTFVKKPIKENFYHGMLLGILSYKSGWSVRSNRESGDGFSDIMIRIDDSYTGIIIEVKYTENDVDAVCLKAIRQINDKHYDAELVQSGIKHILKYGIACNKKNCRIMLEEAAY